METCRRIKRTKEIIIKYETTPEGVICKNSTTAQYVWGANSVMSDLRKHVKRLENGKHLITWKELDKRLDMLIDKKARTDEAINVINQMKRERICK